MHSPLAYGLIFSEKLGHKIISVTYPDKTPFGWAFDNFYVAKDFVKHLSNRNGKVTILGGIEFKLFSNLTTKWAKSSMLGNLLWTIRIDTTKNGTEDSFPMQAHLAFIKIKLLEPSYAKMFGRKVGLMLWGYHLMNHR
jgi:hypothetical protein